MGLTVTHKSSNVNSKRLYKDVIKELESTVVASGFFDWTSEIQRISAVELADDILYMFVEEGRILRYKVISDSRNNDRMTNVIEGTYILDISYRQFNCLNDTTLHFELTVE